MKLYNSMTRKKEEFIPINENEVKMYVCGPTVYNYFHIGNARPFIVFDALRRYFEYRGYKVNYIQNFTDVDDKIIKRANEENLSASEISEKYIKEYFQDADALGINRATHHPKVTENMDDIIKFIQILENKGYAYEKSGDVYFDTKKFETYGKLSGQDMDALEVGARIEMDERKKNGTDFVLWKAKKEGEPYWDSPWGQGRPGWHIECSVMSTKYLGDTLDIHAGGQDLIFPHHENEIAQSEAYTSKPYVRYWIHNGYINIDNQKMSKSKGNFFTVRDILKLYDGEVIRFFMLSAHYRNPVNFSKELIESAENGLNRLYTTKENIDHLLNHNKVEKMTEDEIIEYESLMKYKVKFTEAMDDDLNTADAISAIFELARDINKLVDDTKTTDFLENVRALYMELADVLGFLSREKGAIDDEIENLIAQREEARRQKNWAKADAIRDELLKNGIVLEDTPQGVKWSRI